jgi:hypothetical protein
MADTEKNAQALKDAKHNALKLEFRKAEVDVMTQRGNTSGNLKDIFRQRGLEDEEMTQIISDIMKPK